MVLGAVGGGLAAIIMTPVDVVKTRLMLQVRGLRACVCGALCVRVCGGDSMCVCLYVFTKGSRRRDADS